MTLIGTIAFFAWGITSFVILIDIFKKTTALGCLGLILFPILPLIWVFTGYSGRKWIAAPILYGSLVTFSTIAVIEWFEAEERLEGFIASEPAQRLELKLTGVGIHNNQLRYTLRSGIIYTPETAYTSVETLLVAVEEEIIYDLAQLYPDTLKPDTILSLEIKTSGDFIVVYEISGPGVVSESYVTTEDEEY